MKTVRLNSRTLSPWILLPLHFRIKCGHISPRIVPSVIALVAFSRFHGNMSGQSFVIFVLTIAAAEAALALAMVVLLFRRKHTLDASAWLALRG